MVDYTWVAWFEELATTIARNGERDLADKAKAVDWKKDSVPLLNYGDENIDPMSFLYFLAQKNTTNQYEGVFGSVHEVFGITSDFPEIQPFIPVPLANAKALFHDGELFDPGLLWRLFKQAAPIHERPTIQPDVFNAVLALPQVAMTKLTQTLFIANPSHFLPADHTSNVLPQPELHGDVQDYEGYVARMDAIKLLFPGCEPYEIDTFLHTQEKAPLITEETCVFQISTNVYDDQTDYWESTDNLPKDARTFKENNCVYTDGPKNNYPLREPKRGDIILIRTYNKHGHAIGVVKENGYASDGWDADAAIYVYWINPSLPLRAAIGWGFVAISPIFACR